jgi:hypothetical protein
MMNKIVVRLTIKESQRREGTNNYWYYTKQGVIETPANVAEIHAVNIDAIIQLGLKEYQFDEVTITFNNREEDETAN